MYACVQTLLLQAHTLRGQQLVPELQARLSQLRYTLDTVKARCRNTGTASAWLGELCSRLLLNHRRGASRTSDMHPF